MKLFFNPEIPADAKVGLTVLLPQEEAAHCVRVLRLVPGDTLTLTGGKGFFYDAQIVEASQKRVVCSILSVIPWQKGWNASIHLAVAPTKNMDRMEWMAEKATEMGIDELSFLNCRFSERKVLKLERVQKIVISAMKQSLKALMPSLHELEDFKHFIQQPIEGQKFIAHCYPGEKPLLRDLLLQSTKEDSSHPSITILIGPEGDFSEDEVKQALEQGYKPISLGTSRLRTETAALVAVMTAQITTN